MPLKYNIFGNLVDISGYISTPFSVPKDGYVYIATASNQSGYYCQAYLNGTVAYRVLSNGGYSGNGSFFVKKGMTMNISGNSVGFARYYPLEN